IRSEHPDTAVVMVTVISDPVTAKEALGQGAFGYISKPFGREEVIITVHNALRRRELELAGRDYQADLENMVARRTRDHRQSEERFRSLVEKMNEGLASLDPERRFTFVNARFCRMLGYTQEELIGRLVEDFVEEADRERLLFELDKSRKGVVDRCELTWRKKSGEQLYTILSPQALFDDRGVYSGGFGVITDITERRRAEEALRRELEISTALAETAGGLVTSASLEDISVRILEKALLLTESRYGFVGYIDPSSGYLIAPTLSTAFGVECRVEGRETVFEKFTGLWGWVLEHRLPLLTNAAERDPRASGTPAGHVPIKRFLGVPAILGERVVGMVGLANSLHDYSGDDYQAAQPLADLYAVALERKWREDEIRHSEQRLRDLLEAIPAGVMIVEAGSHVIREINPSAVKMIGLPKEEIQGKECWGLVCPADHGRCPVTDLSKNLDNAEQALLTAKGQGIPVLKTVVRIDYEGLPHFLETFVDISEQKRMEFKLAQAQKLESLGQLAAGIAHEINTPMQFIHSNIEFLEYAFRQGEKLLEASRRIAENFPPEAPAGDLAASLREAAEKVDLAYLAEEIPQATAGSLEGVGRISRIVESMRYFAHPDRQEKTPVSVNEAIENALTISRNQWKYCAEAETDLDPDLPRVSVLAAEFNQVLLNLILNAAQAITTARGKDPREKGRIRVVTRRLGGLVEIRVQDNGAGIPEKFHSRVFDPFFTTKEVGQGMGQGLSVAYNIIAEKHGGSLDFETEVGRGTTFIIRLPLDYSAE
ncbi:MAG: PAS domain S-box protein, partial [Thermodesulfobacteriota bacterium]